MNLADAVIAEAFLANASSEKVYDWLERRANLTVQREVEEAQRREPLGYIPEEKEPDHAESVYRSLVSREEPLVKLGLAQFCPIQDVLREVYRVGDQAVRCAVLSNRWVIFLSHALADREMRELLKTGTKTEIEAVLKHPRLRSSGVLSDVLSGCEGNISQERWFELVNVLRRNPALQENAESADDIYGWMDNVWPFVSQPSKLVWYLLEKFPIEERWAGLLSGILNRIPYKRPDRLAVETMCKIRGKSLDDPGWKLNPSDPEWKLSDSAECELFSSELKALEIKWLERIFARWTRVHEAKVPDEFPDLNVGLKTGLTKEDWELLKGNWESSKEARLIEKDQYARLKFTIAQKAATAALTGKLDYRRSSGARAKAKVPATEDERLTFLKNHSDASVRKGYRSAVELMEIDKRATEAEKPKRDRLRNTIAQIYLLAYLSVVLSGLAVLGTLVFAVRIDGWTITAAIALLVAGLFGLYKLSATLERLGGMPGELR